MRFDAGALSEFEAINGRVTLHPPTFTTPNPRRIRAALALHFHPPTFTSTTMGKVPEYPSIFA